MWRSVYTRGEQHKYYSTITRRICIIRRVKFTVPVTLHYVDTVGKQKGLTSEDSAVRVLAELRLSIFLKDFSYRLWCKRAMLYTYGYVMSVQSDQPARA